MSIYTKLFEIQKQNLLLTADADNPFYKSKYISIENIMSTLKPLLEQQKLLLVHQVEGDCVRTSIIDTEGELPLQTIESAFPINISLDAQKIGAMVSYGKRYNLVALFCIVEDDDDGNSLVKDPRSVQNTSSATYTAKTPQTPAYATKNTTNEGELPKATSWMSEKDVHDLFADLEARRKPMPSTAIELVKELRKTKGVSKERAKLIEDKFAALSASDIFATPF